MNIDLAEFLSEKKLGRCVGGGFGNTDKGSEDIFYSLFCVF